MEILKKYRLTIISLIMTPLALIVSFIFIGGGHGTYIPQIILFPFSMLTAVFTTKLTTYAILLSIIQFPLYGLLIDIAKGTNDKKLFKFGIITAHLLTVIIVFLTISDNFR